MGSSQETISGLLNNISPKNIIRRIEYTEETMKVVNLIKEGKYYFFKNFDVVSFGEKIDWNYQHKNSANSYQLYLQSLEVINHLCVYYEKTKEKEVLEKANDIIQDWIHFDQTATKKSKQCWYNHTVASRAIALVHFYSVANGVINIDQEAFTNILIKHANFLVDEKYYVKYNHGIMMDRALILLSIVLEKYEMAKIWREKGIYRLKEAFNRDFSYNGVHLENSPDYHSMVRRLFISTEAFLNKNQLTLGEELTKKLERTNEYFKYLYKPDKTIPIIGDTSKSTNAKLEKKYEPFIDTEAGIAVLQDENKNDSDLSTWIAFVCGYGSRTHKHNDDLSLNLFYKGKDIFIDSGKYNYNMSDKFRNYIVSPMAHTTIAVKNKTYKIGDPLLEVDNIKITGYDFNHFYHMVKGMNNSYDGIKLERTIIFFKPDILVIVDKSISKVENEYVQVFNLAPHIEIAELENDKALLTSSKEKIEIIQMVGTTNVQKYAGDRELPRAVYSEKFGVLIDNKQVEFTQKGTNVNFATLIKMGQNNNRVSSLKLDSANNLISITIDERNFTIPV